MNFETPPRAPRRVYCLAALVAALLAPVGGISGHASEPWENYGRFFGRVVLEGAYPIPKPLQVFKSRSFCGATVPNETLLVAGDGGLQNTVITLTPIGRRVAAPPRRAILDNRRCAFVPHVQVAAVGSELVLTNSDPILHTVHARSGPRTLFNVGLPYWRRVVKILDRPGVVRIDCDVLHTWMSAAIVVVETPYHAVTDAKGRFSIENLPSGEYHLAAWHERLGVKESRLRLVGAAEVAAEIVFAGVGSR